MTPPPMLWMTPDCEPGIQFCPLQRLPSASNMNRPLAYTPPPAKQSETGEIVRNVGEIRHEGRLAPGAFFRLRVGFVEQRVELLWVCPRCAGDAGHGLEGVRGRCTASRRCGLEEAGAPIVVRNCEEGGDERAQ